VKSIDGVIPIQLQYIENAFVWYQYRWNCVYLAFGSPDFLVGLQGIHNLNAHTNKTYSLLSFRMDQIGSGMLPYISQHLLEMVKSNNNKNGYNMDYQK
jgi:hypothetical protein